MNKNKTENKKQSYNFEDKVKALSGIYTLFIIMLATSGSLKSPWSTLLYYGAFILPTFLALIAFRESERDKGEFLGIDSGRLTLALPTFAPSIGLILLLSLLTSLIMQALTGKTNSVDVGSSILPALVNHAIIPAILEEILFRYVPLKLLSRHSGKWTVVLSAIFFAAAHHNFFTMPYAFAAGVIFMTLDIITDSIYPSLLLHLLNNTLSILLIFAPSPIIYILLAVAAVISVVYILINRKRYIAPLIKTFSGGDDFPLCMELMTFIMLTLGITLLIGI